MRILRGIADDQHGRTAGVVNDCHELGRHHADYASALVHKSAA
jgi:hypothetical protein